MYSSLYDSIVLPVYELHSDKSKNKHYHILDKT